MLAGTAHHSDQRWLGVRRPEFARAGNEDAEAAMLKNALVESAAGRQKLRAALQRNADGAPLPGLLFTRPQCRKSGQPGPDFGTSGDLILAPALG